MARPQLVVFLSSQARIKNDMFLMFRWVIYYFAVRWSKLHFKECRPHQIRSTLRPPRDESQISQLAVPISSVQSIPRETEANPGLEWNPRRDDVRNPAFIRSSAHHVDSFDPRTAEGRSWDYPLLRSLQQHILAGFHVGYIRPKPWVFRLFLALFFFIYLSPQRKCIPWLDIWALRLFIDLFVRYVLCPLWNYSCWEAGDRTPLLEK